MITDIFEKNMILESERLLLRPLEESDVSDLYEIFSDKLVMKYYDLLPFENISEAQKQIAIFRKCLSEKNMLRWGIILKENKKLMGTCGFFAFSEKHQKAEIGYELHRDYWHCGIMTEALEMILNFIFTSSEINRVEAFVEIPNTASQKLLEKIGFTKEGVLRQYEKCRGNLIDIIIYGYLRSDGRF